LRGAAHNRLAHLNSQPAHRLLRVAGAESNAKLLRLFVEQQYGENLVVDGALHHRRNTHHELVEVERGIDLLADIEEQRQQLRRFEQPRHGFGGP
jgi:hypothetical protein